MEILENLATPSKIREKRLQIVDMVILLEEKENNLIEKANKSLSVLKENGIHFSLDKIF